MVKQKYKERRYAVLPPDEYNEQYYLGNLLLGCTNNVLPNDWKTCQVSISLNEVYCGEPEITLKICFDLDNFVLVTTKNLQSVLLASSIKELFSCKLFAFQFYIESDCVFARLYIKQLPLEKFNTLIGNLIKLVFAHTLNIEYLSDEQEEILNTLESDNLNEFYKNIKKVRDQSLTEPKTLDVQHPLLKLSLRPYQQEAVRWMVLREQFPKEKEMLHPLFEEVKLSTGTTIYYNKYNGFVDNTKPVVSSLRTGGILADEMGLGKTVEVLACILLSTKLTDFTITTPEALDSPTVLIQSKIRKRKAVQNTMNVTNPKRLKLSNDWKKPGSKKSNLRLCLNMWYDSKLSDVSINKPTKTSKDEGIYCVCGNNNRTNDTVQCVHCLKYQHGECLSYKPIFGDYICPDCWFEQPLLESKATLIVCPSALSAQWSEEICKHVSGLRIFEYKGSKAPVYPTELLDYDIVITTYSVLHSELRLSESTKVRNLRHARRYTAQGSPVSRINWWRLCLDEAQMVETPNFVSLMAKKLTAQHRWAVTGTPITREISGLYGLIDYLQLQPYSEFDTWKYLLYLPYNRGKTDAMFQFMSQVMWRWSKEEVWDQLGIPQQTLIEYPLEFSAVENFFYRREHNISACDFKFNIRRAGISSNTLLKTLDRTVFNFIMAPLLNIRQACNSAGSTRGRYLVTRKQVTSVKDLLDALIAKNMNFCEENLRMLVSSLNGMAGLSLLANNPVNAVAQYRKVLQLASRFNAVDTKTGLAVDKLQLIHTMYNLAEVLETSPPVAPTVRDSSLRTECIRLQEKYLEKYVHGCLTTYEESEATSRSIAALKQKFFLKPGEWYTSLIAWVTINDLFADLSQRIANAASNASTQGLLGFSDERELLYFIAIWDGEIKELREKANRLLSTLYEYDNGKLNVSPGLVQNAMNCHLRPEKEKSKIKKTCSVCKVSKYMRKYEAKLFEMTQNEAKNDIEDISNKGSWKPTAQELIFKGLLGLGKARNADGNIINDGEAYINMLDLFKKEFKHKRKFWTYLYQHINALDEINMCLVRINFKTPGQEKKRESTRDKVLKQLSMVLSNPTEYINYIEPHELEFQESLLHVEECRSNTELEKNLGTYKYLETLRCQQYAGQTPDPCPICKNELSDHWSILPCGHSYCLECIATIMNSTFVKQNVMCSICRQTHRALDISYIRTKIDADSSNDEFRIKGDYSTKIEAIVKLIIKLKDVDKRVKVLVFSTWTEVLSIIQSALRINNISCEVMFSNGATNSVNNFKDTSENVTVLLLPIHLGSKGLNLIEATHVILTEPLLNSGDELQAIGRVHRIGQTKPTTVHKFIIQNTIEETIHNAIAANTVMWNSNKYTLNQLIDLFITYDEAPVNVEQANNVI